MADALTSITTTPGLGDNLVKQAYDLAVAWVLRETPMYRSSAFVSKRPERPSMPGSSVVLNKFDYLSNAQITAAKTPLSEELDVDAIKMPPTVPVTLTFNEYGAAVRRTNKLKLMSFADVDQAIAHDVAQHLAETLDELVQDVLDSGTNIIRSGAVAADNLIDNTKKLQATDVRKSVTKLRTNKAVPVDGQFYVAGCHPKTIHDLREETGSGSWRVPSEYGADQGQIFRGEFGLFEGARFIQNSRTRVTATGATSANVYRTFVVGREAIAEGVLEEPNVVIGPVVDKLQRFRTVGWYGVLGWALYRNEALVGIHSGSSVDGL